MHRNAKFYKFIKKFSDGIDKFKPKELLNKKN